MLKVRQDIESLAMTWTEQEKNDSLEETGRCFLYGGQLASYLKGAPPS